MRPKRLQQPPPPAQRPAAARRARFPKARRLCKRGDFLQVYRQGRRWEGELFVIHVRRTETLGRLGLMVSRRVGKATLRNRIKRLIREHFRRRLDLYEGLDIIVEVKPQAAQGSNDLRPRLETAMAQACRLA